MTNIRIGICEDEKTVQDHIAGLVKKHCLPCEVALFASGEELLSSAVSYDILILDVQLQGMSGIDAARALRARHPWHSLDAPQIIFVTAHAQHMADAFDVNAFHYLLKPLEEAKFAEVLHRALKLLEMDRRENERIISVKSLKKEQVQILMGHIRYVESEDKLLIIHTVDREVKTRGQIARMEGRLGDGFFRCHRSFIVNLDKVAGFNTDTVHLLGGGQVLLAKKNRRALAEALARRAGTLGK